MDFRTEVIELMNKKLFISLTTDICKFLNSLKLTHDKNTPLNERDVIYFLVDYESYDILSEYIDDLEESEKFYDYTENGTKDFPTIILKHPELFNVLIEKRSIENLLNKKTRDFQSCYCDGSSNLTEMKLKDILQEKREELTYLCKHYLVSTSPSAYTMLINLFDQCILYLSTPNFSYTAPQMIRNAIFQINTTNQFADFVMKHKKVVISGMHGTGKSVFIANFLKEYHCDYVYLSYKNSLQKTLYRKIFSDCKDTKENLSKLLEKPSNSVLIIDDMNPDKELFIKEAQDMLKYNLCIIILTIHPDCPKGYKLFAKPLYSYPKNHKNNNTIFQQLNDAMNFTNENPYLLSLITMTKQQQPDFHLSDLYHNAMKFSSDSTLPQFKHPHHKVYANFWGHAYKLYDLQHYTKDYQKHRKHLKILSCFFDRQVPIHFLKDIFNEYDEQCISDLINMGYLNHTVINSSDVVWLSPALANIIFHHEKPTYTDVLINPIIEKLTNNLATFQNTLQFSLLKDILYPFALRLGKTIRLKNNEHQKNVSATQEKWWDFLYLTIEYYQVMNKPGIASNLANLIQYPDDMQYSRSSYDTSIMNIFHLWINGEPSFCEHIDSLCRLISNGAESSSPEKTIPLIQFLACKALDFLTFQECICIIKDDEEIKGTRFKKIQTYFQELLKILSADSLTHYGLIYSMLFNTFDVIQPFIEDYMKNIYEVSSITQKIRFLCVYICFCLKEIFAEYQYSKGTILRKDLIDVMNFSFSNLETEIKSINILPGLLGQMCFAACYNNLIFQNVSTAFQTDIPPKILSLVQSKGHTIQLNEITDFFKTMDTFKRD